MATDKDFINALADALLGTGSIATTHQVVVAKRPKELN